MKRLLFGCVALAVLCSISGCRFLYPNTMFKQKEYQFYELQKQQIEHYVIKPGDQFTLRCYSRDGFKLIDVLGNPGQVMGNSTGSNTGSSNTGSQSNVASNTSTVNSSGAVTYLVDAEGFAKVPILGEMYVQGYTEPELERVLAEKYASLFVDPFVVLKVTNRRAFVFKGSIAVVVPLNEAPTNLIEVIAKAGGLERDLKAYKVKLIRGDLKNPQVQLIDLSTLEGVRDADLTVQSNDIIYIEQRRNVALDVVRDFSPLIAILSSVTTLIVLLTQRVQ